MQSSDLVSSFGEIARAKDIERDTLQLIVEDVFRAMIEKRYGADEGFEIIFNPDEGDIQILHIREVVADWDLDDPVTQIEESDAKAIDEFFEIGEEVPTELEIEDFGRRAVMTGQQTLQQQIRDIEKEQIYEEYSELVGEIVVGEIYQTRRRDVLLMKDDVELLLPGDEQIRSEFYRKGDMLRAVVKEVKRDAGSDPQVIVSRAEPVLMERLFELEVPEVYEGIVEIKKVARIPGERAKVAVVSHDERVDPVGACVGVKGVRIHAVVRELDNENIDVLLWDEDPHQLIVNALSPANPVGVRTNDDTEPPRARVDVPADEVSQAIGKRGVNIRLASKLTEYEIDVYRDIPEDEEDIEIEQFGDVLSAETIEALKLIGCDTGKAVLELKAEEMARRAGEPIDEENAERIIEIIETEFERGVAGQEHPFEGDFVLEAPGTSPEESEMDLPGQGDAAPPSDLPESARPAEAPAAPRETAAPAPEGDETPEGESPEGESLEGEFSEDEDAEADAPVAEEGAPAEETGSTPGDEAHAGEPAPEGTPAAEEEAAAPDATPAPNVTPEPDGEEQREEEVA